MAIEAMNVEAAQDAMGFVKGVRHILEQVVRADDVIRMGLSVQATIGDLQRAREAEGSKLVEAKQAVADVQTMLDRAKQAVAREQVRLESLLAAITQAQTDYERAQADLQAAVDQGSADYRAKLEQRIQVMDQDFETRAHDLSLEIEALTLKRDGLQAEIKGLLDRLQGA